MANPRYKFTFRAGEVDGYGTFTLVPKSGWTEKQVMEEIDFNIKTNVADEAYCSPGDVSVTYTKLS